MDTESISGEIRWFTSTMLLSFSFGLPQHCTGSAMILCAFTAAATTPRRKGSHLLTCLIGCAPALFTNVLQPPCLELTAAVTAQSVSCTPRPVLDASTVWNPQALNLLLISSCLTHCRANEQQFVRLKPGQVPGQLWHLLQEERRAVQGGWVLSGSVCP